MPLFEYICNTCETPFEKLVFNEETEVICPGCGSKKVSKQFSSFSAHTAGSSGSSMPIPEGGCPSGGSCPSGGGCPMAG